jgi:hypothetical protein
MASGSRHLGLQYSKVRTFVLSGSSMLILAALKSGLVPRLSTLKLHSLDHSPVLYLILLRLAHCLPLVG